jgi:methylmalonyl-CoA carboxyltransferase 1.3S subunit
LKLRITIDDKTWEVDVEAVEPETLPTPRGYVVGPGSARVPAHLPAPTPSPQTHGPDDDSVCRSPIAGIVVRVVVQAGQSIQTGDILAVLEAMKMETNITAPRAGKVAKVRAAAGDAVQSGQVLVEFE